MKDMLRLGTKDRKKYLIISVVSVLVIALITVSIIAVQLRHNKNEKKKNVEETTVHTMMVQETTVQETTEEDTTQEESAEVVDREVVEEFFENEISTENEEAFELPPRQLTDEFIPYDGQKREITCYGDSMMAGAGSATEGKVNGIDIYGWTTPVTIENLTNIPTHNLGGSGESSSYITFRAGGTKVYIDRDITISETDSAIARITDEDGNVFKADDYSGYGFDYDPYPGDMYINGYLCDVDNVEDGYVSIKLTKGYAAYDNSTDNSVVIYESETAEYSRQRADIKAESEKGTESSTVIRETESQTSGEKPTEIPTEKPTEKPAETSGVEKVTISGGTQAMTRASQERSAKDILILEMGSNGGWENDYQQLILQYDDIILNSGCKYYIVLGDTDDPADSADANQGEYGEDGNYVGIGDTAWEAALREAYGEHFFNTRTYMIQNGLTDCGLDTTTDDLENFKKGNISEQLRYDWTHFNCYGYYSKGIGVYKKGVELGYWS
ncbi:MAG: hypothetical protein ACLUG6_13355 [Lachnospira eligens]|jgi:hypothetical protein